MALPTGTGQTKGGAPTLLVAFEAEGFPKKNLYRGEGMLCARADRGTHALGFTPKM